MSSWSYWNAWTAGTTTASGNFIFGSLSRDFAPGDRLDAELQVQVNGTWHTIDSAVVFVENPHPTTPTPHGGSGMYYMRARWYDPTTARFITQDPIRDGMNWYIYCGNDPINYHDPTGLYDERLLTNLSDLQTLFMIENSKTVGRNEALLSSYRSQADDIRNQLRNNGYYIESWDVELNRMIDQIVGVSSYSGGSAVSLTNSAIARTQVYWREHNRANAALAAGQIGVTTAIAAPAIYYVGGAVTTISLANLIPTAERIGSALQSDVYHRAPSFLTSAQLSLGRTFDVVGGDGVRRTLLQVSGAVNNVRGVFEYLVQNGQVVHQLFKAGSTITGRPN